MKSDINYLIRENTFLKSKRMNVVNLKYLSKQMCRISVLFRGKTAHKMFKMNYSQSAMHMHYETPRHKKDNYL